MVLGAPGTVYLKGFALHRSLRSATRRNMPPLWCRKAKNWMDGLLFEKKWELFMVAVGTFWPFEGLSFLAGFFYILGDVVSHFSLAKSYEF